MKHDSMLAGPLLMFGVLVATLAIMSAYIFVAMGVAYLLLIYVGEWAPLVWLALNGLAWAAVILSSLVET